MKTKIAIAAIALLVLCAAAMTLPHWLGGSGAPEPSENKEGEAEQSENGIVTLDEQKLASLELRIEPAGLHPLQVFHVVPGRIRYDDAHHVDIRAAANGTLILVR